MKMNFEYLIDVFAELGARLECFGSEQQSQEVIRCAAAANEWFTRDDMITAVNAIRMQMLGREGLRSWIEPYELTPPKRKQIGIIMAGNIPLVGFFDLLCVVVAGCEAVVKYSSKDRVLMEYVVELLRKIDPEIPIRPYEPNEQIDAIIATGSDNTNRYFRTQFRDIPSLLRGSRSSVAVLSGGESDEQLRVLANDIFTYSGLGCRNVSHLFVPDNYDVRRLVTPFSSYTGVNPKYKNNYLQNRALLLMNESEFVDGNFFTLRECKESSLYISELTYERYARHRDVEHWLVEHDAQLQCVVSDDVSHPRNVGFGEAQYPKLSDYPDAVDVIEFIKNR